MELGEHPINRKVIVVGAGIAGLACAHYIKKYGIDVEVIERERTAGGNVRTSLKEEKYIVEFGPSLFSSDDKAVLKLARELSIDPQIIDCRIGPKKIYIFKNGRFHRVPRSALALMSGRILPAFSKARIMMEKFIVSRSADAETVAEFVIRRCGRGALKHLADPLITAFCAGDPMQLEVKSALPLLVELEDERGKVFGGIREIVGRAPQGGYKSFRWGMGTITARLEEEMRRNLMTGVAVERIGRTATGEISVAIDIAARTIYADAVVVATPAPETARLMMELDPGIVAPLMEIPYVSLVIVHTSFGRKDVPGSFDGIGFVIPRGYKIRTLGVIMSSTNFQGRCPDSEILISNIMGGALDPDLVDLSDEEIKMIAQGGLEKTLGIRAEPKFVHIKRWRQVIPQYNVGHAFRIEKIRERLKEQPGIFLTGSYLSGISFSDVIFQSRRAADDVVMYLRKVQRQNSEPRSVDDRYVQCGENPQFQQ